MGCRRMSPASTARAGVGPRRAMRTWRNFYMAMLLRDPDEPETDDERVRGERQLGKLRKQGRQ
jgi:hypothetical protein